MQSTSPATPTPKQLATAAAALLRRPTEFSRLIVGVTMRRYQAEVLIEIARSALNHDGREFAVMFSRQAGKNELSAHLQTFLLNRLSRTPSTIVKAAPVVRPQLVNSMLRLAQCLSNPWNLRQWTNSQGYMMALGKCRVLFLSAHPQSTVVGATASHLLECDEAQDVDIPKWDKDFLPMCASTNATRVYYGTAWTSKTLLAQTIDRLESLEKDDGQRRVFRVPWDRVAEEVPAYGDFVTAQIKKLGENHPIIKTQYLIETIDELAGFLPASLHLQMRGDHPHETQPVPSAIYALTIDVAGSDQDATNPQPGRDSTAITVHKIDLTASALGPVYRAVTRYHLRNQPLPAQYGRILDLARSWQAQYLVVDATGIGAGLAAFLAKAYGETRVIQFHFSSKTKSDLGWGYLALIHTGRWKDHRTDAYNLEQTEFWQQVRAARSEIRPGPGQQLKWSAEPHDDSLISAALSWPLDSIPWSTGESAMVTADDPLDRSHQ